MITNTLIVYILLRVCIVMCIIEGFDSLLRDYFRQ